MQKRTLINRKKGAKGGPKRKPRLIRDDDIGNRNSLLDFAAASSIARMELIWHISIRSIE